MSDFKFPPEITQKQIDPALLTFAEYVAIANKDDKWHPSSAYNHSLADMNDRQSNIYDIKDYPKLLQNLRVNGLSFQIRVHGRKCRYCKRGFGDDYLRDKNGDLIDYTDDEIVMLGLPPHEFIVAIFENDGKKCVAALQDEWGCVLITVAKEYRGFGFGPLLTKIGRKIEPGKTSGGFTSGGFHNFKKVYSHFVREALASGLYRRMVASKQMTMDRVREIVGSIQTPRETPKSRNLGASDPKDWLLYVGEYGDFVLYDRKIRELIDDGWDKNEQWLDRMILGIAYVSGEKHFRLMQFGGVSTKVRTFMMCCALEHCRREGETLWVEGNEPKYVLEKYATMGDESNVIGFKSREATPSGKEFNYDPMAKAERIFRKQFDLYGEFRDHVEGMAYAKFHGLSEGLRR